MSGDSPASILYDSSGTEKGTGANPVRTDPTGTTPQPVSVASLPLPTGAATQATVATLLTEADFDARVGNVSASPTANTVLGRLKDVYDRFIAQLPAALIGGRLDTNIGSWLGSTAPTIGQKVMADSLPVVVASDNTIAVSTAPSNSVAGFTTGDVTTAVIAEAAVRSTAYTEQTTNAQRSIVSTSANDSAAGTGVRSVLVTYLDATGAGPYTETLVMNGTTPVNFVNTNVCFIEKMRAVTAGSGGVAAGTINLKAATGGGGATVGSIAAGDRQTQWAHHYVPVGKTANITSQWGGHTGTTVGSGGTFVIRSRAIGVADAIENNVTDKFRLYGQSSSVQRNYGSAIKVVGPARLTTYVLPETSTSTNYRASFDYYET